MAYRSMSFMERGQCAGSGAGGFFPEKAADERKKGKALCRGCPVTNECLEYALAFDSYGVWGGTTRRERTKLRRLASVA